MKINTNNHYCKSCKLHEYCVYKPTLYTGNINAKLLILGDTPTVFDSDNNDLLAGKHGQSLKTRMSMHNLDYVYSNAVKCAINKKPNRKSKAVTPSELKNCSVFTIKTILELKPKVILALGKVPVKQLLGLSIDLKIIRGKVFYHPELDTYIVPTYSIKQMGMAADSLLYDQFKQDLQTVSNILKAPPKRKVKYNVRSLKEPEEINAYLEELLTAEAIALDVETKPIDGIDSEKAALNPITAKITDISFSHKVGECVHIEWDRLKSFHDLLQEIFESESIKVMHNAKFDNKMLLHNGFKLKNVKFDTQLAYHTLNMCYEGGGALLLFKLKTLAWLLTDQGGYERVLDDIGGIVGAQGFLKRKTKKQLKDEERAAKHLKNNLDKNKPVEKIAEVLLRYFSFDWLVEFKDDIGITEEVFDAIEYKNKIDEENRSLIEVQQNIDVITEEQKIYEKELDMYFNYIQNERDKRLEGNITPLEFYSAMDSGVTFEIFTKLRYHIDKNYNFLFYDLIMPLSYTLMRMEYNGLKLDIDYMKKVREENDKEVIKIKDGFLKKVGYDIDLKSPQQLSNYMYGSKAEGGLGIKPDDKYKTPTGKPSTDVKAIKHFSSRYPILQNILDYRELEKQTSTYLTGFLNHIDYNTSLVHASYFQHSTATGRLSCIAKGAKISMPGTTKQIENIKEGDLVCCYDDDNKLQISEVTALIDNGFEECIKLKCKCDKKRIVELILTPDHLIKNSKKDWVRADSLSIGDNILNHKIISITKVGYHHVYDLTIKRYHNFIANDICVHNCTDPAVQTIPKDNKIRNMVVASKNCKLLACDLSQAELRILAMLSHDKEMINAFESGRDLHISTACNALLNIDYIEYDKNNKKHLDARNAAKAINFGIVYGMSAYSLAMRLGFPMETKEDRKTSFEKAEFYINSWFKLYSDAKLWIDSIQEFAKRHGYVETVHGRRRYIPSVWSSDVKVQESGLRQATNTPIQGTASDITNFGMIRMQEYLDNSVYNTKLVAVIHDCIMLDTPDNEVEHMSVKLVDFMTKDIPGITISLKADLDILDRWEK